MSRPLIIHCCYHKCLTVYFYRVLRRVADEFDLNFQYYFPEEGVDAQADMVLFAHSELDPAGLIPAAGAYRGTHVIRDPRDLLISAYFYHLRTDEEWCTKPNPLHNRVPDDMSYQQYLQTMDIQQGLIFEMDGAAGGEISNMGRWDYQNSNILELRFEDIVGNERDTFARIFQWYQFAGQALTRATEIGASLALRKISADDKGKQHARKGSRIGQWEDFFTPEIKAQFKRRYGRILIDLGYVEDADW